MGDGMTDIRDALSLRKIINAAGPVSVLGGGAPSAAATAAALAILPHAVEIAQLQAIASRQIAAGVRMRGRLRRRLLGGRHHDRGGGRDHRHWIASGSCDCRIPTASSTAW